MRRKMKDMEKSNSVFNTLLEPKMTVMKFSNTLTETRADG